MRVLPPDAATLKLALHQLVLWHTALTYGCPVTERSVETAESLHYLAKTLLGNHRLVVVSNAEPYVHDQTEGMMDYMIPPGGVITALDPIMRASGGIWVAHGRGKSDWEVTDSDGCLLVPPEDPQYTLRRVFLSGSQFRGYYDGLANGALWPLCHTAFVRPRFDEEDWASYVTVNRIFAEHVKKVIGGGEAVVLVQDYHLALLPQLLKEMDPRIRVAQFWHIPWPSWETFRVFPWAEELLEGLLPSDLVAFHTPGYCRNFLESAEHCAGASVDYEQKEIVRSDQSTHVRAIPIGVDVEQITRDSQGEDVEEKMEKLKTALDLEGKLVGIGLEREDYIKGIPERLQALDRFFLKYPEYRGRVVFIQVGVPSRSHLTPYGQLSQGIAVMEREINERYGTDDWRPIRYLRKDLSRRSLLAIWRLADFCIVSSLHDGMNLVAKEFVASRADEDGVLLLSSFTGAAVELVDAIKVNPFAIDAFADSIKAALTMPREERRWRMAAMRAVLQKNNVYTWAADLLVTAVASSEERHIYAYRGGR